MKALPQNLVFTPKHLEANVLGAQALGIHAQTTDDMVIAIEQGLPFEALEKVAAMLFVAAGVSLLLSNSNTRTGAKNQSTESLWLAGLSLAVLIGMSSSTYQRRKREQKLTRNESEGVYRYAALLERTKAVFGNDEKTRTWLNSPIKALGDRVPLDYAKTEPGANLVMQVLGRLEHGSYS